MVMPKKLNWIGFCRVSVDNVSESFAARTYSPHQWILALKNRWKKSGWPTGSKGAVTQIERRRKYYNLRFV